MADIAVKRCCTVISIASKPRSDLEEGLEDCPVSFFVSG